MTTAEISPEVASYLGSIGLPLDHGTRVRELTGGVSAVTLEVSRGDAGVVVKTSLERLRVAVEWTAPPERIMHEARTLQVVGAIGSGAVPEVLMTDEASHTLVMSRVERRFVDFKQELIAGRPPAPGLAERLGRTLAAWHVATCTSGALDNTFDDQALFHQLRVEPFHERAALALPNHADTLRQLAHELTTTPRCLVHGDFSPKNLLVDGSEVVVLDWEVAHRGNPVFDQAFFLSHVIAKAIHLPDSRSELAALATGFMTAYRAVASGLGGDDPTLLRHVAGCLLGRIHGRSPLPYLTPAELVDLDALAIALLTGLVHTSSDLWELILDDRRVLHL